MNDAFQWPRDITPVPIDEWRARVDTATAALPALPTDEYNWDRYCAIQFFAQALTRYYPWRSLGYAEARAIHAPFVEWLAGRSDRDVLAFVWELLAWRGDGSSSAIGSLNGMGRLRGSLDLHDLELAVSFAKDADAMSVWPYGRWRLTDWDRASPDYIRCLKHESYVVRAWAAKALGQLCLGCLEHGKAVPFAQTMALILEQEQCAPGVAGAFLNGTGWNCVPPEALPKDFDYRSWFLEALRISRAEPAVPHVVSLEFLAHEFFDLDPDAIREMLRMGRRYLAVMTATDLPEAIPILLPVLQEMAASSDPEVSAAITEYLRDPEHHAALDLIKTRP